jgi:cell wall-associated NlpC family hydrolase
MAAEIDILTAPDQYLFPRTRRGRLRPCPHCQKRRNRWLFALLCMLSLGLGVVTAWATTPAPAYSSSEPAAVQHAVLASSAGSVGGRILDRAETKTGHWYSYGSAGPTYFDCSGLVYWAATSIGERNWPRDTYGLIHAVATGRLSYTSHPQRGDLAFFGTGHVELVTIWYHQTFGAHKSGTQVSWRKYDPRYYGPTFFLHINW